GGPATTRVEGVDPPGGTVPRNLLRLYLRFSAPMAEGGAARHVRLVRAATGEALDDALLLPPELWDPARRRLTVLLDPARIKRGLAPHREAGYPLREGEPVDLVVDAELLDAGGRPLREGFTAAYEVGS